LFPYELERFTKRRLSKHLSQKDPNPNSIERHLIRSGFLSKNPEPESNMIYVTFRKVNRRVFALEVFKIAKKSQNILRVYRS
jgi:hypothetical protein|tara:strand:- start:679 stop:924 length:246 start_codon:yes stop_codon:yes gene_type:complete